MTEEEFKVEEYSEKHARSITEHLFEGVPENVVRNQRDELLKAGSEEVFSVCALSDSQVVGVCTGVRMRWYGSRHRIEMVQVVVSENYRGRGIARVMMRRIAEHFAPKGVEILQISAEADNTGAIAAYEQIGFQRFGLLKNGINHDGKYSDEVMMAMPVKELLKK
ncbi:GNAT family N-acetyltransferase [Candidatus Thorarchaeota archaeon]|nr:MAG: GNAT family N-acetyltransferase [Candidatus Thorarchaeota archaeon]